jgi:hypothetical protein
MRIFVSGALNSNSVGFMNNMRKMWLMGREVEKLGVRIYVPINDFMMSMICGCLTHEEYYNRDLMELEHCDAMVMVEDYENSVGAKGERELAQKLGIPIFETIEGLKLFLELDAKIGI